VSVRPVLYVEFWSRRIQFRCRYYLSTKTKLSLYYTLVYPYLTYCNIVWSSNYKTNLKRIYLLQKRIVRALTNSDFRTHTAPLFTQLKILDIYKINAFHVAKFMLSYHHRLLPPSFHNLFITSHQVHSYNTRSSNSYRSHLCKTNTKQFTILFQGPKIWNSLHTGGTCPPKNFYGRAIEQKSMCHSSKTYNSHNRGLQ
jgi:hypothetical protein